jgi:hypothetical protein
MQIRRSDSFMSPLSGSEETTLTTPQDGQDASSLKDSPDVAKCKLAFEEVCDICAAFLFCVSDLTAFLCFSFLIPRLAHLISGSPTDHSEHTQQEQRYADSAVDLEKEPQSTSPRLEAPAPKYASTQQQHLFAFCFCVYYSRPAVQELRHIWLLLIFLPLDIVSYVAGISIATI